MIARLPAKLSTFAAVLGAIAIAGPLLAFRIYSTSVDLGLHYLLAKFIFEHGEWPAVGQIGLLEMNSHPPVPHTLAALGAVLVGSPVLAMHLISLLCVVAIYFLIALAIERKEGRRYAEAVIIFIMGRRPISRTVSLHSDHTGCF
jgi:4-amino-4-deoxy-L-arabinose transferase-like glycosyltransferase